MLLDVNETKEIEIKIPLSELSIFASDLYRFVTVNGTYEVLVGSSCLDIRLKEEFSIKNKNTGKILFGEIKRQDGWVEGKDPSAGRGNAHERMCKLFTPGLMKKYRELSGITSEEILPFWVVLEGDITRDPKRNREIAFWFDKYDKNYFMWRPQMTDTDLVNHFLDNLSEYLD